MRAWSIIVVCVFLLLSCAAQQQLKPLPIEMTVKVESCKHTTDSEVVCRIGFYVGEEKRAGLLLIIDGGSEEND